MNFFESLLEHPSIHRLGLTLMHFVWQGVAVGANFAGGYRPSSDASSRSTCSAVRRSSRFRQRAYSARRCIRCRPSNWSRSRLQSGDGRHDEPETCFADE